MMRHPLLNPRCNSESSFYRAFRIAELLGGLLPSPRSSLCRMNMLKTP